MAKQSKRNELADDLKMGSIKKKSVPDTDRVEAITKKVYQQEDKKEAKGSLQYTSLGLPKKTHFLAKVTAMEEGTSLKGYIKRLIEKDLTERGKM